MAMHLVDPTHGLALLGVVAAAAALVVGDTMARVIDRPRVTVGHEGILICGLLYRRYIPIAALARADASPRGVVLTLRSDGDEAGEEVILPIDVGNDAAYMNEPGAQRARRDALMDQLRRVVDKRAAASESLYIPAVERQGAELPRWHRRVKEALGRDYRSASYTADALVGVVRDPDASREQRIGAAMALGGHSDPAIRRGLQIAIDTCADPDLAAALEAAADSELEDPHILEGRLERALGPHLSS
jgi:hypothetical protein